MLGARLFPAIRSAGGFDANAWKRQSNRLSITSFAFGGPNDKKKPRKGRCLCAGFFAIVGRA